MKYLTNYYKLKKFYNECVEKVEKDSSRLKKRLVLVENCYCCEPSKEYELVKDRKHLKLEKDTDKARRKLTAEIEKINKDCFWQRFLMYKDQQLQNI